MPLAPAAGPGTTTREEARGALRESTHVHLLPPWVTEPTGQAQGTPISGWQANRWGDCKKPRPGFTLNFLSGPQFPALQSELKTAAL